jgi:hypothetical protein
VEVGQQVEVVVAVVQVERVAGLFAPAGAPVHGVYGALTSGYLRRNRPRTPSVGGVTVMRRERAEQIRAAIAFALEDDAEVAAERVPNVTAVVARLWLESA